MRHWRCDCILRHRGVRAAHFASVRRASPILRQGADKNVLRLVGHGFPSRKSDAVAQAITQIGRRGTGHHANPTLWHKPSRKSGGMAEKGPPISGIRRHGTNHLANRAKWCHSVGFARFRAPFSAIPPDLRDGGARFCHTARFARWRGAILPYRRICVMARAVAGVPAFRASRLALPLGTRPFSTG
jgi:hypothetical protein